MISKGKSKPRPGLQPRISHWGFKSSPDITPTPPRPDSQTPPMESLAPERAVNGSGFPRERSAIHGMPLTPCVAVSWIFTLVIRRILLEHGPVSAGPIRSLSYQTDVRSRVPLRLVLEGESSPSPPTPHLLGPGLSKQETFGQRHQ